MKILLSFSNPTACDVVELALQAHPDLSVARNPGLQSLPALLGTDDEPGFDLIACDHPTHSTAIAALLLERQVRIPMVLFEGPEAPPPEAPQQPPGIEVFHRMNWATWAQELPSLLDKLELLAEAEEPDSDGQSKVFKASEVEFHKIRPALLLTASPLPADVFIGLSPIKFLKLFRSDDPFDQNDYDRFANQKQVSHFFLKKEGLAAFIARLSESLQKQIAAGMSEGDATAISEDIHKTVQQLFRSGNVPPEAGELIKSNLQLTLQAIGKKPRLQDIMNRVTQRSGTYLASHSVALCQVSCTVAAAMDWGSPATFSKLNFAAFLHDCALDSDELSKIQHKPAVDALRASHDTRNYNAVLKHGLRAAELCRTFNEVPPDVDQILIQHHERPDGSGFPRGLTHTAIAPLAAVFIIAHDLVGMILEQGKHFTFPQFIEAYQDVYTQGQFKKIFRAIHKL